MQELKTKLDSVTLNNKKLNEKLSLSVSAQPDETTDVKSVEKLEQEVSSLRKARRLNDEMMNKLQTQVEELQESNKELKELLGAKSEGIGKDLND